jgi:hypothetical protein
MSQPLADTWRAIRLRSLSEKNGAVGVSYFVVVRFLIAAKV